MQGQPLKKTPKASIRERKRSFELFVRQGMAPHPPCTQTATETQCKTHKTNSNPDGTMRSETGPHRHRHKHMLHQPRYTGTKRRNNYNVHVFSTLFRTSAACS